MGQRAAVDGHVSEGTAPHLRPFSLDQAKSLSSNAPVTASRYHNAARGGQRLEDDYVNTNQVVGTGICGEVTLVRRRADWRRYAVKTMRKSQFTGEQLQHLSSEVEIYLTLDHPNIARLHDVFETEDSVKLLMQFSEGGELYARLRREGQLQPPDAAEAARQMLRAVGYLHSHHIVHRDIKLENFVYESWASYTNLKLIDFGMAVVWDQCTPMVARCGSLMYVSPDVLCGEGYTDKCDLWSLGVIVWMLLTGVPPFDGDDEILMKKIRAGQANWSRNGTWEKIPVSGMEFLGQLLEKDPTKRPSAREALQHTWLAPSAETGACSAALNGKMLRSMQRYLDGSSLRRALLQFVAHELDSGETHDLQEVFLAMDRTNKGTLSFSELQDAIRHAASPDCTVKGQEPGSSLLEVDSMEDTGVWAAAGRHFKKLDANGDEQIYFLDFLAATMESLPSISEGSLRAAFKRLDADGSGFVSASNLRQALGDNFEGNCTEELLSEAGLLGHGGLTLKSFSHVLALGSALSEEVAALQVVPARVDTCESRKESTVKAAKAAAAECSLWATNGSGRMLVELLEWTIGMFAPASGSGGLGTSAVALFSSPGTVVPARPRAVQKVRAAP